MSTKNGNCSFFGFDFDFDFAAILPNISHTPPNRQSNIDLVTVSKAFNATAELAACGTYSNVRLARVAEEKVLSGPLTDLSGPMQQPWALASNDTCHDFSATCYFAARDLYEQFQGKVQHLPTYLIWILRFGIGIGMGCE